VKAESEVHGALVDHKQPVEILDRAVATALGRRVSGNRPD